MSTTTSTTTSTMRGKMTGENTAEAFGVTPVNKVKRMH